MEFGDIAIFKINWFKAYIVYRMKFIFNATEKGIDIIIADKGVAGL